jgi:hypothetical protein
LRGDGTRDISRSYFSGRFTNRGVPNAIVSLKGAKPHVLERAKRDWNNLVQGFRKAWSTHFVNSDIDVKILDVSFKEQQLVELRKNQRDVFQQTSGSPPEKMGIVNHVIGPSLVLERITNVVQHQLRPYRRNRDFWHSFRVKLTIGVWVNNRVHRAASSLFAFSSKASISTASSRSRRP